QSIAERLARLSREEGVTLFMTLMAGYQALLYRYSGQEEVVVGTPIAGRNRAETEGLIGPFLNTLALRADFSNRPSFRELLKQVREVALGAYGHQDLPFEKLVEELQPARDLSRHPIFQTMLVMQNARPEQARLTGLSLEVQELESTTTKFDLML